MFLLKKLLTPFFLPVSVCIEILLLGAILLWFTRWQKTGKVIVTVGLVVLTGISYGPISHALLQPLEYKYPSLLNSENLTAIKWVVVLGGGHVSNPQIPATSRVSSSALVRLVEGIRLYREGHGRKLILTGGVIFDPIPHARVLANIAQSIGVDKQDLVLEDNSMDTKDEARFVRELVGEDKFILVTSATHMPRSMALFRNQGMEPIPAPAGHIIKKRPGFTPGIFFPGAAELYQTERAVYEYLGMAWARLRGQIE
jgi:uncharacterized SAM-binding protein YcdF (DUF218 family)